MLDGNYVTVVSDLHYCVICLDVYQSPADLDRPLSVYAFSTSWCPSDMYIKLHLRTVGSRPTSKTMKRTFYCSIFKIYWQRTAFTQCTFTYESMVRWA